jgi:uncharacterized protein YbaP (TraB family)
MRTPSRLPLLALALVVAFSGACKKSDKKEDPGAGPGTGTGTAAPAVAPDAGGAATRPPDAAAAAPDDRPVRAFFYKVEKDGKVNHILGTMHMGIDSKRLPRAVSEALDGARAFAMEANAMDPTLIANLKRDDGKTLEEELGPEYWKKLEGVLGADMAKGINGMKASTAAALLEIRGLPMTQPMDLALLMQAKSAGAKIIYLEEARMQQELLDRWLDARMVKVMLDQIAEGNQKTQQMLDAYVAGDDATVEKLTNDRSGWEKTGRPDADYDQMMKELLADRNASWIAPLEEMFEDGKAFAAVGAAHLIGKGSVIELLQAKGYEITRIEP